MGPYRGGLHGVIFGWDGWFNYGQGWLCKILAELKNIETFQQLEKMVFLFCAQGVLADQQLLHAFNKD